ncbi:hypothetical protein HW932_10885 [Allochromatium humboldtianum]|uniref:DUF6915 domain-containing protein n=1 Tax=Allochromatium humboldtianum TaxID=504901 RepID=A0A850RBV5_9GAMM|nr:hypothetical protein [Allochromatium humboldtianum]NVZ09766.1 hypothetical protein [Allochromatium humboldtianum]
MSKFEVHCQESVALFGQPYAEVHRWLDALAGSERYGMRHRRVRHHEAGIREAMRLFGDTVGPVARQHIVSDLKEEGWTESDPFPQDEADYVRMGLF